MATIARNTALQEIREKVVAGERLDLDDGMTLLESHDVLALGEMADLARRQRGGTDDVYFVNNLYLNYTTICRVKCKFCAFSKGKLAAKLRGTPYDLDMSEIVRRSVEAWDRGATDGEIFMVIQNGAGPEMKMKGYKGRMSDTDTWNVVNYLRSLGPKKK